MKRNGDTEWQQSLLRRYPAASVGGFPSYAPEVLEGLEPDGYDPRAHAELANLEADNWWFRSRNALIVEAVGRWFPDAPTYLEIGCGTGFVLRGLTEAFPDMAMVGSELFLTGLAETQSRLPNATLIQMDARHMPFREEFSLVGAYDVIEHIEEDLKVLTNIHGALRPGGGLILTVPQHEWLWSLADEQAHHVRRYTRSRLHSVVRSAGYEILWSRSFVSLLTPLMLLSRRAGSDEARQRDPYIDFRIKPSVNRTLERVSSIERSMVRHGVRFPVGGSRILVARKAPST